MTTSGDFALRLRDYALTTATIQYYFPDRPLIINPNTYTWQEMDLAPRFPALQQFLDFWESKLDGRIHSVRVSHCRLITPAEIRHFGHEFRLQ